MAANDELASQELRAARIACAAVLARLATLSDAPAGAAFNEHRRPGRSTKNGIEYSVPRGTDLDGPSTETHPPSRDLSLHAHYKWRMERAAVDKSTDTLLHLASMARRDWRELQPPGSEDHYRAPHDVSIGTHEPPERIKRLLAEWEGRDAMEVATWERCPVAWVRRQRVLNKRDPETGNPVEQQGKLAKVVEMVNEGKTQTDVAKALGISKMRVTQMLDAA